jgi:hypothetical protein
MKLHYHVMDSLNDDRKMKECDQRQECRYS